ncbi:Chaperone protein DnaJ [Erysiphe necator]|nr:Chaperone protein DnaJ [Erysiphe necator]
MVKSDISRDYYEDLELCPKSDSAEIKRQYKKLALLYHPDRNVGSNTSDTTKFQRIQAAYEILNDPLERARYDANRRFSVFTNTSNSHSKYNTKGNPWSNIGKEYPPPPKPPMARSSQPPPSSNGSRRYEKYTPPQQSAYQASQEGAQARKATYDAWEKMRGYHGSGTTFPSPEKEPKPPNPPPRNTSNSNRKERRPTTSSRPHMPNTPNDKNGNQSNIKRSVPKKGFMPSTPGGDELPAPKGFYSTTRTNQDPPPIPPRNFESSTHNSHSHPVTDNNGANLNLLFAQRTSTPYATHGGERFDPFEAPRGRLSRSKSTTEKRQDSKLRNNIFQDMNSDSRPNTTQRARSFSDRSNPNQKSSSTEFSDFEENIDITFTTGSSSNKSKSKKNEVHVGRKLSKNISEDSSDSSISPVHLSPRSNKVETKSNDKSNIFSFSLDDDTFASTNDCQKKPSFGRSIENISTKFSAEDWDGKFSAGSNSDFFKPNSYTSRTPSQTGNRVRTRSPTKCHTTGKRVARTGTSCESSYERKFSVDEWSKKFQPQIFMPPQTTAQPILRPATSSVNGRKRRTTPGIRPILSSSAPSISITKSEYKNSNQPSQESSTLNTDAGNIATPEPMDIDTPLDPNLNPTTTKPANDNPIKKFKSQESSASASYSKLSIHEVEAQTSALKLNFSDLKIKDLVLDFPLPPNPPVLSQKMISSASTYREYEARYQQYMLEWDQFDKKFLLHLVARKNKNESLGSKRWKEQAAEYYRNSVREDQIVLRKWAEAKETHAKVVTEWIVFLDLNKGLGFVEEEVEKKPLG